MGSLTEMTQRANALKESGNWAEAIAAYEAIVSLAPNNGAVIHNLAAALGDAGRYAEATAQARRAFATGLDAPETWLVLARALIGDGQMDDALNAFREAVKRRPADRTAQRELAQLIWMLTGDLEKSLASLNDAISRLPQSIDLQLLRAETIGQAGDAEGEYREIVTVLHGVSAASPFLELTASNAALASGHFVEALQHAQKAAALAPAEPQIIAGRCRALLANGEALEASRLASRLRSAYPLDQLYIALQATAWRLLGDERHHQLYNYNRFVKAAPLACPSGWPSIEKYIDDLIEALDRKHQYKTHPFGQSVRHGGQLPSILALADPVLNAFAQAIQAPVKSYLGALGSGADPLRIRNRGGFSIFSAWSVRLKSSGFHVDHVHPQGWLSSACHLRLPAAADADDRSGWLTLGRPGVPTQPALEAEHFVKPETGVMVVFPSYMWHGTVPFAGESTRLSVAADLVPAKAI